MFTTLIVAFCFLYTVSCWYSLRRTDAQNRSRDSHPACRYPVRKPSPHGDDQDLF